MPHNPIEEHREFLLDELKDLEARRGEIEERLPDLHQKLSSVSDPEKSEQLKEKVAELEEEREDISYKIEDIAAELDSLTESEVNQQVEEKLLSRIENLEERTEELLDRESELDEREKKLEELEQSARDLLERTTSSALGEEFNERKSDLESVLRYWKIGAVGSITLLLISAAYIYYDIARSADSLGSGIAKVTLLLPISVAVWFTVTNYRRQKRLMEEYEFRARMALSLTGFREVLREEAPNDNSEIVAEFVKETMEKIYTNPHDNVLESDSSSSDKVLDSLSPGPFRFDGRNK